MVIYESAVDAWRELSRIGGIEPDGRDSDLVSAIALRLSASASTLDEALEGSSAQELAIAIYSEVSEFAEMMSAILKLLKSAGAKQGQSEWNIRLRTDDIPDVLREFRRFVRESEKVVNDQVELPALRWDEPWSMLRSLHTEQDDNDAVMPPWRDIAAKQLASNFSDRAYEAVEIPVWDGFEVPTRVLEFVVAEIRRHGLKAGGALAGYYAKNIGTDHARAEDSYSLINIAQLETDFWAASLYAALERLAHADRSSRQVAQDRLATFLRGRQTVLKTRSVSLGALKQVLALPAWRARHDVYAAWVGAEIVVAARNHVPLVHAEEGRIDFGFRETLLASFERTASQVQLYSERKFPAVDPIGASRVRNVQPDFSFWLGEECLLVIEVKHYKTSSPKKFAEAVQDYARAADQAPVLLASHGRTTSTLERVAVDVRERCFALEKLVPSNPQSLAMLQDQVWAILGDPVEPWTVELTSGALVLLDVSGSMVPFLTSVAGKRLVRDVCKATGAEWLLAGDVGPRARVRASASGLVSAVEAGGGGTDLEAILDAEMSHGAICIVTDDDGVSTLKSEFNSLAGFDDGAVPGVRVVRLTGRPRCSGA